MKFSKTIQIEDRIISPSSSVFIIAEAGVNHNGDVNIAKQLVDVAVQAKADAVKFQAFKVKNIILKNVEKAPYQQRDANVDETQYEMLKKLELSKEQNREIINYCRSKNIIFITTPYDEESLNELDEFNLGAYKVASTDLTNIPLLIKIAQKGIPIILSTGMSYLSEVEIALEEIYQYNNNVILLQCTANYPIDDTEANLNIIKTYGEKFDIILGYSDHSVGIGASPYAIPLGAKVIEKHFTLEKDASGPDHLASLSPEELVHYVKQIRKVEEYLGKYTKIPTLSEYYTRKSLQKYLVAKKSIKIGEIISDENLTSKRTGGVGISPLYFRNVLGKTATKNYEIDDIIDE